MHHETSCSGILLRLSFSPLVHVLMYWSEIWPAGLLGSGGGVGPAAVEALQAACCSVTRRQAAALLVQHIQVSRQAAQLQEARLGNIWWHLRSQGITGLTGFSCPHLDRRYIKLSGSSSLVLQLFLSQTLKVCLEGVNNLHLTHI